ncbi:hypothetical protein T4D_11529 [Trichinella pseudospiralis]|uniref:Uncharacterized protein n=1 Tax=Trichinella pseudospiralis TaxID=6337 RepID=A0A0V1F5W7_TRIPS|nr:hypothetical protein T4D_11529 [Trichinella pseudospiralis]
MYKLLLQNTSALLICIAKFVYFLKKESQILFFFPLRYGCVRLNIIRKNQWHVFETMKLHYSFRLNFMA